MLPPLLPPRLAPLVVVLVEEVEERAEKPEVERRGAAEATRTSTSTFSAI
jgi:hypothetical protein